MASLGRVVEIALDLGIGKLTPEPSVIPEKKGKDDQQKSEGGDQEVGAPRWSPLLFYASQDSSLIPPR